MDITMADAEEQLTAIVVTALGIKKEKKALGYATTALSSADLEDKANGDISRILMGKAAGVSVVSASGLSGSGSSINIRGLSSLGNNQPLIVIDGVRFNSATTGTGFSSTSRFADIDPNNIASLNVLKGLSASALYGADGKNGVIVITTKSASSTGKAKKTEITVNSSVVFNEIASLPKFTNERGQGYYDSYFNYNGNWGATFGVWGRNGVNDNGQIRHPYRGNAAFIDAFPIDAASSFVDYKNYKSQENFFRTGVAYNNNISINGGSKDTSYNVYFGNLDDEGFMPGNSYKRQHISVGGTTNLSNNFTVSGTMNYSNIKSTFPFTTTIFRGLFNTPRSIDLAGWPYQHPVTGQEIAYSTAEGNPYWVLNNAGTTENVHRIYAQLSATYKFNDNLNVVYRYGLDNSITNSRDFINRGQALTGLGGLSSTNVVTTISNHSLILNYDKKFFNDKLGLTANAGIDIAQRKGDFTNIESSNQIVYNFFEHQNFLVNTTGSGRFELNRPGYFGQVGLDYNNFLFLNLSGRQEWTSNYIDNKLFYPSASLSFVLTDAFKSLKGNALSFLKLRAGFGSSADFSAGNGASIFGGNFTPYPISQNVDAIAQAFDRPNLGVVTTNQISGLYANLNLKPALIEEREIGVEAKFLKNRISLEGGYFDRNTRDLIFPRILDASTGYTSTFVNANKIKTWGYELEATFKVIEKENLKWSIGGNFTKIDSRVVELDEDRFQVTQTGSGVENYLIEGQPINMIMGIGIARDAQGRLLVDDSGEFYKSTDEIVVLGNPTPDYTLSGFTAFDYKNFRLTANVQYTKGGDVFLRPAISLLGRGLTTDNDGRQGAAFIMPGVYANGNTNNVVINTGDYHFNNYLGGTATSEVGIFDGTFVRLQEVALSYSIPKKALSKLPFGDITIGLVGENLYMKALNVPEGINIDINASGGGVNSNSVGIVQNNSPSSRRYGFSVKFTF
jgi:TonB-linked SusC/RagA family outer membrane protein